MSRPTVSTVIPTHNRSELLRRALASVAAQTRAPDEVIVVDDGSSDDTCEWLAHEPGVTLLRQDNAGVSAARNRGIAAAAGEWIALLDSDDEWAPRKLERQLQAIADEPGYLLCHADEIWIRNGRRVNPMRKHAKAGGHIFTHCLPLCAISPSAVVMHRQLLDAVGEFDESLPACEDYDMWLRVCSRYPVLYVDEPLVVKHGGHSDQLSRRHWGMDRFRIQALERVLEEDYLRPADREAARETLINKIDVYLEGARKRDKGEEVARYESLRARWE
jgi:glycosyltransferase involved in cell wall biosynthesis